MIKPWIDQATRDGMIGFCSVWPYLFFDFHTVTDMRPLRFVFFSPHTPLTTTMAFRSLAILSALVSAVLAQVTSYQLFISHHSSLSLVNFFNSIQYQSWLRFLSLGPEYQHPNPVLPDTHHHSPRGILSNWQLGFLLFLHRRLRPRLHLFLHLMSPERLHLSAGGFLRQLYGRAALSESPSQAHLRRLVCPGPIPAGYLLQGRQWQILCHRAVQLQRKRRKLPLRLDVP